jgi:hypothetical protein
VKEGYLAAVWLPVALHHTSCPALNEALCGLIHGPHHLWNGLSQGPLGTGLFCGPAPFDWGALTTLFSEQCPAICPPGPPGPPGMPGFKVSG